MFENPYNPYYQQPKPLRTINWVSGRNGANGFQLQPSENVILLDNENEGVFYIKVADNVGMCSLRTFKFEEITEVEPKLNLDEYVRKSDLQALLNEMLGGTNNDESVSTTKSSTKQSNLVY